MTDRQPSAIRQSAHDRGSVKLHPWGDPMVDTAYANSACPGYSTYSRPKEADY